MPSRLKLIRNLLLLASVLLAVPALVHAPRAQAMPDTWSSAGSVVTGRESHTATLLLNGKVLVAEGHG